MRLEPTIEKFYLDILDYAGLTLDENENIHSSMGEFTLDGKHITLPYFDSLKNPNNRKFFHLLNESYLNPETALFDMYQRKLVLEINLRLSSLFTSLLTVASDPLIQRKAKSTELIELIANLGEMDLSITDSLLKVIKASSKKNDTGYLINFYLKKNGTINDVPYAAIGKVNFKLLKEIQKGIEDKDYSVYDVKLRKKDLVALNNLFQVVFPGNEIEENYQDGTDNKIFRYLNALLKTTYMVSSRINRVGKLLEELAEPSLETSSIIHEDIWINLLEPLYNMADQIRMIPNQNDLRTEAHKLKTDESKAKQQLPQPPPAPQQYTQQPPQYQPQQPVQQPPQYQPQQQPQYQPQYQPQQQPQYYQQPQAPQYYQQPQAPQYYQQQQPVQQPVQQTNQAPLTVEEIIRGKMENASRYNDQQSYLMQQYQERQLQPRIPNWVLEQMPMQQLTPEQMYALQRQRQMYPNMVDPMYPQDPFYPRSLSPFR